MSALHQAVARAIADLQGERSFWADSAERRDEWLAAAAIRVCRDEFLATIQTAREHDCPYLGNYKLGYDAALDDLAGALERYEAHDG